MTGKKKGLGKELTKRLVLGSMKKWLLASLIVTILSSILPNTLPMKTESALSSLESAAAIPEIVVGNALGTVYDYIPVAGPEMAFADAFSGGSDPYIVTDENGQATVKVAWQSACDSWGTETFTFKLFIDGGERASKVQTGDDPDGSGHLSYTFNLVPQQQQYFQVRWTVDAKGDAYPPAEADDEDKVTLLVHNPTPESSTTTIDKPLWGQDFKRYEHIEISGRVAGDITGQSAVGNVNITVTYLWEPPSWYKPWFKVVSLQAGGYFEVDYFNECDVPMLAVPILKPDPLGPYEIRATYLGNVFMNPSSDSVQIDRVPLGPTDDLIIVNPIWVDENMVFYCVVLDYVNETYASPMAYAYVTFIDVTVLTDVLGNVRFRAPDLYVDPTYDIVASKDGSTSTSQIEVRNREPPQIPVALFRLLDRPIIGRLIRFDGSLSYDRDGTLVSYSWNFGDGYQGSGIFAGHWYQTSGFYPVTLTIRDNDNLNASTTLTIYLDIGESINFDANIKIGVIGPYGLPHWSPGMKEAAEMARDEINLVNAGSGSITLVFGNEYAVPTPDPMQAAMEMERLVDPAQEDCDFVIGGFRTECTTTMIEVAADYGKPFIINGASADELISDTVGTDYARYKYLFRINPVNTTQLLYTVASALQYYMIPVKLLPLFGQDLDGNATTPPQVRVAVLMEDLEWTLDMYYYLTNPAVYPYFLGPYANVTYAGRIPDGTSDCSSWLNDVKVGQARLVIHVFSGVTGVPLIAQAKALNVSALFVGINTMGQMQTYWATTGGACQYESIIASSGTRTPIVPGVTTVFWDNFVTRTGAWPLYTAFGAYDAIYAIAESVTAIGSTDKDALVAYLENPTYMRQGLTGLFKFTSTHDVFSFEPGPTWNYGFVRAFIVQWYAGKMEVVYPIDQCYSKWWWLPPNMYPHREDCNIDGKIDMRDIGPAARAFGSIPCAPDWDKDVDVVQDDKIDMRDIGAIARKFGVVVTLPLP